MCICSTIWNSKLCQMELKTESNTETNTQQLRYSNAPSHACILPLWPTWNTLLSTKLSMLFTIHYPDEPRCSEPAPGCLEREPGCPEPAPRRQEPAPGCLEREPGRHPGADSKHPGVGSRHPGAVSKHPGACSRHSGTRAKTINSQAHALNTRPQAQTPEHTRAQTSRHPGTSGRRL